MNFTIGNAFSQGWRAMKENYGALLGASLVYSVIEMALGFVPILGPLAGLIITGPLVAGWMYMGVRAFRGRTEFGDLFIGFRKFGETLGIYWLMVLVALGAGIPLGIGVAVGAAAGIEGPGLGVALIGGVVSLVIYIVFAVRFAFSWQVCLDTQLGVTGSMGRSWKLTQPHLWGLIGLFLCVGLMYIGLLLMCLLPGIFLGMPLTVTVIGAAYCLVAGELEHEELVKVF